MLKAKSACACRCGRVTRSSRPRRIAARSVCPQVRDQDETTISRTDGSVQSHRQTEFSVGRSGSRLFARVPQANGQVGVGGIVDADLADPAAFILVGVKAHAPTMRMPLRKAGRRHPRRITRRQLLHWNESLAMDRSCPHRRRVSRLARARDEQQRCHARRRVSDQVQLQPRIQANEGLQYE